MPIIKIRSYDPTLAALYGRKRSRVDRLIMMRSKLTHTELQFSEQFRNISFSATTMDPCKCARFKMIEYKHPERWQTVSIEVSSEQEYVMFKGACQLAGLIADNFAYQIAPDVTLEAGGCYYDGVYALKYDLAGVSLSFVSKLRLWQPHQKKVWCTESVAMVLLEAFPMLLTFPKKTLRPDDLAPDDLDRIVRCLWKCEAA